MSKVTRVVLGVISGLFLVFAAGMLVAFVALVWLPGTHRSADGYATSDEVSLTTDGYAITSQHIDFGLVPGGWLPAAVLGTFRINVDSTNGSQLFVGVAPSDDVDSYLASIPRGIVTEFGPWRPIEITEQGGTEVPANPESVDFWTASTTGYGPQSLEWEAESGEWTLVVMNTDGGSDVDVSMSVGVDTPWLALALPVTAVLGLLSAGVGVVLAVFALRRPASAQATEPSTQPAEIGS